jgi:hypothetical protein
VDASGNVYVADNANKAVYKLTPGGAQTTLGFTGVGYISGFIALH